MVTNSRINTAKKSAILPKAVEKQLYNDKLTARFSWLRNKQHPLLLCSNKVAPSLLDYYDYLLLTCVLGSTFSRQRIGQNKKINHCTGIRPVVAAIAVFANASRNCPESPAADKEKVARSTGFAYKALKRQKHWRAMTENGHELHRFRHNGPKPHRCTRAPWCRRSLLLRCTLS